MSSTEKPILSKNFIPTGLSCLKQTLDSKSHTAVIKVLFATVALENAVYRDVFDAGSTVQTSILFLKKKKTAERNSLTLGLGDYE